MDMKRLRVLAVAIPATAAVAAITTVGIVRARRRRRRRRAQGFLPRRVREAIREMLSMTAADFLPGGVGMSLYQRRLNKMSDRSLLVLYAVVKAGSFLRKRGADPAAITEADSEGALATYNGALASGLGRTELLGKLGSLGYDALRAVLKAALAALPEQGDGDARALSV